MDNNDILQYASYFLYKKLKRYFILAGSMFDQPDIHRYYRYLLP